jgi:hypothetical protein
MAVIPCQLKEIIKAQMGVLRYRYGHQFVPLTALAVYGAATWFGWKFFGTEEYRDLNAKEKRNNREKEVK